MVNKKQRQTIWVVEYSEVRRHSRVLYIPLDPLTCRIHKIEKGDILKVFIVEKVVGRGIDENET